MQHLTRATFRGVLATICILTTGAVHADLSFFKRSGVMKISGKAAPKDAAKLNEQLTPDIKTIVLYSPEQGSWNDIREMTKIIEKAEVTTVAHGSCYALICSALFLSGKQRQFSGALRPEASYVRIAIGEGHFPEENENKGAKWSDVMDWYRGHTNLGYSGTKPLHNDFIRAPGILPAESKMFFPVSAKTSKGNTIHCWGNKQNLNDDCEAVPDLDALKAGIVTTAELFRNSEELKEVGDVATPASTNFAKLEDAPPSPASDACRDYYAQFLKQDAPRAFVVSTGGSCAMRNAQSMRPYFYAMDACKKVASAGECRFYAVDDQVVFTPFDKPHPKSGEASVKAALQLKPADTQILLGRAFSKADGPQGISDTFSLEGKIMVYAAVKWDVRPEVNNTQKFEARWFIGDKHVRTSQLTEELKASPHIFTRFPQGSDIGVGTGHVEVYANGILLGSKPFTINAN